MVSEKQSAPPRGCTRAGASAPADPWTPAALCIVGVNPHVGSIQLSPYECLSKQVIVPQ